MKMFRCKSIAVAALLACNDACNVLSSASFEFASLSLRSSRYQQNHWIRIVLHTSLCIEILPLEKVDVDCTGIGSHFVFHRRLPDTPASGRSEYFRDSCSSCVIEVVRIAHCHAPLDLIIHSTLPRISTRWLCYLLSWTSWRLPFRVLRTRRRPIRAK